MSPTYSVMTWDSDKSAYTPQKGLSVPSSGLTLGQLRTALKELRRMGYSAHYVRDKNGSHYANDWAVLVERER